MRQLPVNKFIKIVHTSNICNINLGLFDENSCKTLSICTLVIAAPWRLLIRTRLRALPIVKPKPRSRGSAITVPWRVGSFACFTTSCAGFINSAQFLWIMRPSIPASAPCPKVKYARG